MKIMKNKPLVKLETIFFSQTRGFNEEVDDDECPIEERIAHLKSILTIYSEIAKEIGLDSPEGYIIERDKGVELLIRKNKFREIERKLKGHMRDKTQISKSISKCKESMSQIDSDLKNNIKNPNATLNFKINYTKLFNFYYPWLEVEIKTLKKYLSDDEFLSLLTSKDPVKSLILWKENVGFEKHPFLQGLTDCENDLTLAKKEMEKNEKLMQEKIGKTQEKKDEIIKKLKSKLNESDFKKYMPDLQLINEIQKIIDQERYYSLN